MLVTFVKGQINDSVIYIKVSNTIMPELFDVMHDNGYTITISTADVWDYNIYNGESYEVDTLQELEEFEETNNKVKTIRNAKT